jgi:mRNA deadenylase 3'-5' endonuclease subunit Ccr4
MRPREPIRAPHFDVGLFFFLLFGTIRAVQRKKHMKKVIHVNQHKIRSNTRTGQCEPVLTCKTYKDNQYGHEVVIYGQDGKEAARVVYSPDKPLSCGARVWIETSNDVKVIKNEADGR